LARQPGNPMSSQTWTLPAGGQSVVLFSAVNAAAAANFNRKNSSDVSSSYTFSLEKRRPIRADDDSKHSIIDDDSVENCFVNNSILMLMSHFFSSNCSHFPSLLR